MASVTFSVLGSRRFKAYYRLIGGSSSWRRHAVASPFPRGGSAMYHSAMGCPSRFTENDVTQAMKGAKAAGFTRIRLHIDPLGSIVINAGMERMKE